MTGQTAAPAACHEFFNKSAVRKQKLAPKPPWIDEAFAGNCFQVSGDTRVAVGRKLLVRNVKTPTPAASPR
jgi:hypothetical protein